MNKQYELEFRKFISCLQDAGCLNNIMVIGSWAEYLYKECGLLEGFYPSMQTIDVDFLIPNINQPRKKTNLIEIAKERGFLYQEDSLQQTSRFIGRDNFEVEFIASQKGSGDKPLPRTTIGVNAQQLTHMSVLIRYPLKLEFEGVMVLVPEPEAYIIQKMIINNRRGLKAEKDREKIKELRLFVNENRLLEIEESLTKKEKQLVDAFEKRKSL